jgi:hypothetical protein
METGFLFPFHFIFCTLLLPQTVILMTASDPGRLWGTGVSDPKKWTLLLIKTRVVLASVSVGIRKTTFTLALYMLSKTIPFSS